MQRLKPQVPDFCPVCDAVDHPFKPVERQVTQEFRGETFEVPASAMRCGSCGFEIAAPGQLEALRLAVAQAWRLRHILEEGALQAAEARGAMKQILETTRANNTEPMVPLKREEIYDR
ncbi:MAG: hypothetical protein JWM59_2726 [Verrucomicrobiales bacterium]|nr:hypothetical protein [Verrucomicrobiales bacterium]